MKEPAHPHGEPPPEPPSETAAAALAAYPQLAELARAASDPRDKTTVGEIVAAYLTDVRSELAANSYKIRASDLKRFAQAFGSLHVAALPPLAVKEWIFAQECWRSPWTRDNVSWTIQRCFNWAVDMRLLRENPIRRLRLRESKEPGRAMKPAELQALMRASDPCFRRFLIALKLTGARPSELARLRWSDIRWGQGIAVLQEHKTRKKTGKPRVLVFCPQMLKLLAYIRTMQHWTAAFDLKGILQTSPRREAKIRSVLRRMRKLGHSYLAIAQARKVIGATIPEEGRGRHSYTLYRLPQEGVEVPPTGHHGFVFLCSKCRPWTRSARGDTFRRLRKLLGLPASCKLYGLRHSWITQALRQGVNPRAVAALAGHTTTEMIERVYCHLAQDLAFLSEAARQATGHATGSSGQAAIGRPAPPANGQDRQLALGPDSELVQRLSGLIENLTLKVMALEQTRLPTAVGGVPRAVMVRGA
jgi:integrase